MGEVINTVRHEEKTVSLSNQSIMELGYMVSDFMEMLDGEAVKLTFEQANCYQSVFYLIKDLLKSVDQRYLSSHEGMNVFFNQGISREGDVLKLKKEYDITLGHNHASLSHSSCPICGGDSGRFVGGHNVPLEVMIGKSPLCPECAGKYAPELVEARDLYYGEDSKEGGTVDSDEQDEKLPF